LIGKNIAYINNGQTSTKEGPLELAKKYESQGAGEIILTSIDRECMRTGYDINVLQLLTHQLKIPVIINGGASCKEDLINAIDNFGASGAAAGSLFCLYGKHDAVLITYGTFKSIV
jgi:cyclase